MAWTNRSVIAWAKDYLQSKGCASPRLDAEVLLAHALGRQRISLYLDMDKPLDDAELTSYRYLLKRRADHEPVAYIRGFKEFYSREFLVNRSVLIPRAETEFLVDKAIELAPQGGKVFEIGVGSGAVIASILLERPDLTGYGNDISLESVKVARGNAERLGVKAGRLSLFVSDLFNALSVRFPMVVANPPYVSESVRMSPQGDELRYEPGHALFAGNDGLDIIREIIVRAPDFLMPGGKLIMEMGFDQKGAVENMADAVRYLAVSAWIKDLAGIDRAVILERMHG